MNLIHALLSRSGRLVHATLLCALLIAFSACGGEAQPEVEETEATTEQQPAADTASVTLESTLNSLQGGITNIAPDAAVSNIDGWISRLEQVGGESTAPIVQGLQSLRGELTASSIDGQAVGGILSQLGQQTSQLAGTVQGATAQQLEQLGSLLSQAGQQLTGGGGS